MPTYSYEPENIGDNGVDRMRFELGDTTFAPAELTAALSDEEYASVISMYPSWKKAKIAALEAILMKFAHSCDTKIGPVSYSFSQRVDNWKALYDEIKDSSSVSAPSFSSGGGKNGKPYFYEDMQGNPRKGDMGV